MCVWVYARVSRNQAKKGRRAVYGQRRVAPWRSDRQDSARGVAQWRSGGRWVWQAGPGAQPGCNMSPETALGYPKR